MQLALGAAVPDTAWAAMTLAAEPSPEELYEQGKKDYRLGKYKDAVQKWEEAYARSENALILYNISLAYEQLFGISGDVGDLRRSRAVLQNFINVTPEDEDAPKRLAELDKRIAELEAKKGDPKEGGGVGDGGPGPDKPPVPKGADPGKKLRIAGAATLGVGGALVLAGVGIGIGYSVKSGELKDDIRRLHANDADICGAFGAEANWPTREDAVAPGASEETIACYNHGNELDTTRHNGRVANLAAALGFGLVGGIGVVAIIAGAVVFARGDRATKDWRRGLGRLEVVPMGRGLALRGRF
jgi:tetratricopeptide (TPR) repeat protein